MSQEKRISVRVSPEMKARVENACYLTGIDEPTMVKKCVEALLDYIEKNKSITFPLQITPKISSEPIYLGRKEGDPSRQQKLKTMDEHSIAEEKGGEYGKEKKKPIIGNITNKDNEREGDHPPLSND